MERARIKDWGRKLRLGAIVRLAGDCGKRRCLITCRLAGQQKAGQVCTYTLDGVGNLKTMWEGGAFPRTFTHDPADRLVTMIEGSNLTTYTWTGYGALSSQTTGTATTDYSYNGQDHLAVVTEPSGDKTTYSFDGDGLRRSVATTNQNQDPPTLDVTTFVWDGSDYLLLNEPTQNRVVLTLDGEIVSCGSKDLLTDPLGSLVKEVSAGASLGSLVELYPYGTLAPPSANPSIPFVYVGASGYYTDGPERDYIRAREVLKKLGRWMQTDALWPEEIAYRYASANPTSKLDPAGTWPVLIFPRACLRKGKPDVIPVIIWPRPCEEADREACNRACAPDGEGTTKTSGGMCLCYCTPVWMECALSEILRCIQLCKRAGLVFDKCPPFSVTEKFDPFKHCKCKKP
ncbi:MAG: hypothetical protein HND43_07235 [Armatimonadetes bacterium]|nr:hypothetical protein [Armatimonadota bacterium]NOG39172.1 hypothetical protein [Armatimonadota bacterium]GIK32358.1 MAG: hypothetical protein BroJett009_13500 [Armatimonadota bacterium]